MDKREIILQNNNIRSSIQKNIDTIKNLIEESDDIKRIIEQLKKQEFNKFIAQDLEKTLQNINSSIQKLLDQTNILFDSYKRLIQFTFKS
jgi:glycerol-3-phosphate responsive antiterminator